MTVQEEEQPEITRPSAFKACVSQQPPLTHSIFSVIVISAMSQPHRLWRSCVNVTLSHAALMGVCWMELVLLVLFGLLRNHVWMMSVVQQKDWAECQVLL